MTKEIVEDNVITQKTPLGYQLYTIDQLTDKAKNELINYDRFYANNDRKVTQKNIGKAPSKLSKFAFWKTNRGGGAKKTVRNRKRN